MYIERRICVSLKMLVAIVLAVLVVWSGARLNYHSATRCERHLNSPFIAVGVLLLLLSLIRLALWLFVGDPDIDIDYENKADSCICFCLLVLFCVLLGYTIFALAIATPNHFPKWLRNRVADNHWRNVKNCLVFNENVCSDFVDRYKNDTYQQFQASHFSPIQSGCCKPLKECNFTYISPANWTKPTSNGTYSNLDCGEWDNDEYILCFNCQTCKDGFLHEVQRNWKKAAIVNIIVLISLTMLWWCGDCGDDPDD